MRDRPALARVTYDRAADRRGDPHWLADAWSRARVIVVSPDGRSPVRRDAGGHLELRITDPATSDIDAPRRLLGVVDKVPYFSITVPARDGSTEWETLREVAAAADDLDAALLTSAVALQLWHRRHTHCPICGTPTVEAQAGWIRVCPNDASEHFPRTDPAVIMVVHDGGDRCLLGRGQAWGEGRFSTLAGFVEPGESLEGAVAREVWEEVRVEVADVRYVASQPWPFPSSLMVGLRRSGGWGPDVAGRLGGGGRGRLVHARRGRSRGGPHRRRRRGPAGCDLAEHLAQAVDLALSHRLLAVR